jgi:hypothetical protein
MPDRIPVVVVVDHESSRRHRLADAARHAGARSIEVGTPLEAIALVEVGADAVDAIVVADELTQTRGDELVDFMAEEHPDVGLAVIADDDGGVAPHDAVVVPCDGHDATERFRVLMARVHP